MYGLVNKAIEQMVCSQFGEQTWQVICERAGIQDPVFLSMQPYADEVTYRLVEAASALLGIAHSEVLHAFGRYWTLYTAAEGYGQLLQMNASTLQEFLENLDNLHARVGLSYPELTPPEFHCTDITDHSLLLHYYSMRQGLAPMVTGLLEGLSVMFATPIAVELVQSREAGHDHEVFRITYIEE